MLFLISMTFISVNAADYEDYAPVFYFESEEKCYPVDVSYHLNNANLDTFVEGYELLLPVDASTVQLSSLATLIPGITEEDIQYTHLDNTIGNVDDKKIIEDYQNKESSLGYKVYYRSFTSEGNQVIQYWMFYAFNDGELNKHEGDWEMVQVVIPSDGSSKWVAYSQHHSGQKANWNQVEKSGTNIKVYVARGSHANYLRSYSGKLGIGMGSDYVGANGKFLEYGDYELEELSSQDWLEYNGRWGEVNSKEDIVLGRAGPYGPKFRESGSMWDNSVSWGNNLMASSDSMFLGEWFIYNFVTIFIAITIITLVILLVKIYYRHKKYGLGPRIVSMLYIDGINLKSVGNILCFIGIFLAILGLFFTWYSVSGDINIQGGGTNDLLDIIVLNGIEGIKVNIPAVGGSMPVAALVIPFSLIIGIGIVFMIISTVGLYRSKKLGWKYIFRGIRLFVPIILLIIIIMAIGSMISPESLLPSDASQGNNYVVELLDSFSNSPLGGEKSISISEGTVEGSIYLKWGLGTGAYLLIFSGIIMFAAGVLEIFDNKHFFEPKTSIIKNKKVKKPVEINKDIQQEKQATKEPSVDYVFCPQCGNKLSKDTQFCTNCGNKMK